MATESTKITETTDSNTEGEQDETRDPKQLRESPVDEAVEGEGEDADASGEAADDDVLDTSVDTAPAGGFAAGAVAVVSAGLGLCSLTGTPLGDMLRARKELIGQIEANTGGAGGAGGDQIDAFYGAPWHTAAFMNGVFALAAVVIGGVLLALHAGRADTRPWVKAVALGGLVLGAIGLLVAGGMYFDLFASKPELPQRTG
ncbi:hypothetical protein [Streptomyces sp. NPDC047108]|uniref:hypothetical protein n=1 Tax=Streptomyces sp. NPDC047108 TaxID=3155025 RepID=UPI0033C3C1EA